MLILEQRWNVAETAASESSWTFRRSAHHTRCAGSGDYTYLYNQSAMSSAWQRRRFFTSLAWTPFSWLRGRFRRRNPILRRRNSGRASRGSSSIRRSTVSSTIWKALTRSSLIRARSSGPSPAIRDYEDYSRVVSGFASVLAIPEWLLVDSSSVSNRQEDDPLRRLINPVNNTIVTQSKTKASLELAAQPLAGIRLGLQQSNLLVNSLFEVRSQFPEVLLEPSGRF